MRTRVKICGITRLEDALEASRLGADALGLVFYEASPRAIGIAQAKALVAALPPFVSVVGLFVDAPAAWIRSVLAEVPLDLLQFHGDESPADCECYARPYIKAVRMRPEVDLPTVAERYASARGLLLDAYRPGVPGGTGECFDWGRVPALAKPVVLAGGLDTDNVARAIATVRPYAVDVSGGVELGKGIKDHARLAAFMRAVAAPA